MTATEIVEQLKTLGRESYKKVLATHGVPEPAYGVKIEDLKKIQKQVRHDNPLARELYDTGVYDAMYLAGLVADGAGMTKKDLRHWVKKAHCAALREYTVPWVAAESPHGRELALEWIDAPQEGVASSGWATLASLVAVTDDDELDLDELTALLQRVQKSIHGQPNRVRYVMNNFVIAVGCYVRDLTELALRTAARVGPVAVDMGGTACKVPNAAESIQKVQKRGAVGKKRKTAKC